MSSKKKKLIPVAIAALLAVVVILVLTYRRPFLYAGAIEATEVDVPARVSSVVGMNVVVEGADIEVGRTAVVLACEDIKLAADLAERNYERAVKLVKGGSMPEENYERLRTTRNDAVLRREWCDIKAPISGTVLEVYREPGEWVSPGMKLFTLADLAHVYAYVYVPEPLLATLHHGMALTGYLPELGMREIKGTIAAIREKAEFTPKNVQTREERTRLVHAVKVAFENPGRVLKPGMSIEVRLPE